MNVGWRSEQKVQLQIQLGRERHCISWLSGCWGLRATVGPGQRGGRLLEPLVDAVGLQISESFGHCPRAAFPGTGRLRVLVANEVEQPDAGPPTAFCPLNFLLGS